MHQEAIGQYIFLGLYTLSQGVLDQVMELDLGSWSMSLYASSDCVYFILKKLSHSSLTHYTSRKKKIITQVVCSLSNLFMCCPGLFFKVPTHTRAWQLWFNGC